MKKLLLVLLAVFFGLGAFSQITNVRKWRKTEKDSLNQALLMYEENLFLQALPVFESILKNHPNEQFIQYSYAKCALYRSDKHEDAYKYLSEIYAKNKKIDEIDYDLAKAAHFVNKLDEATTAINLYRGKKLSPENKSKADLLKRYIDNADYWVGKPTSAKISNLGDAINSEGEEYVPSITADESTLIYTYVGPKSLGGLMNDQSQSDPLGTYHEDIYMSVKQNNEFATASGLANINTDAHDAAISISNDGSVLFVYRDNTDDHGDIYESFLNGTTYSSPKKIKGLVNSYSWDGHCSLSPDGRTLYFCSERGGGYGGRDIYKATMLQDSTWGNIVNLGDSINTTFDEDAPFMHPDGVTLYFSSKGRSSMGGYDVFRSVMSADSTFKSTENLGFPINSTDDDVYFVLAANNKHAYYSSGRPGGKGLKDIYRIEPNFSNKAALVLVKGIVKAGNAGVASAITVEVSSRNNAPYKSFYSNTASGAYLVSLPAGAAYKLTYNFQGQAPQTLNVDATSVTDYTEKINDVTFTAGADAPVASQPTLAAQTLDSAAVATNSTDAKTSKLNKEPVVKAPKEEFVPQTKFQAKTMNYVDKYGDIKADDLDFKVQIGAFKNADNITYPNLEEFGKLQKLVTEEGLTKIFIGGSFKTLRKAFEFNKKIIAAGQSDAFVAMTYKGKRSSLEELESLGIFKTK
jgi:tetratricopeptide (TPR) repeat protein/cell division septation protein DedD